MGGGACAPGGARTSTLPRMCSLPIWSIVSSTERSFVEPSDAESTTQSAARASGIVARFSLIERVAKMTRSSCRMFATVAATAGRTRFSRMSRKSKTAIDSPWWTPTPMIRLATS